MIDTHAHLDDGRFRADLDAVIARAREVGVETIICPGVSADSSEAVQLLAAAREELSAAVGIQPNSCAEAAEGDWDRVVALAGRPGVVAIGETGLDRHWDFTPFDLQQDYFDRHLRLARKVGLPVVIHCREAEEDLLPMLHEAAERGPLRGVIHAFSGDADFADECLELGLHISFAGAVTYRNSKFQSLWTAGVTIPDDRLLIETDSPYLTPHPLRGKQKRNEPANVRLVAKRLAELRAQSVEQVVAQTTANARGLFSLG